MKMWQLALGEASRNGETWLNLKAIKELNVCDTHIICYIFWNFIRNVKLE